MHKLSIETGNAFVLVYSIQSRSNLRELAEVYEDIKLSKQSNINEVPIMLAGNKNDLVDEREVSMEEGKKMADEWMCGFIETSAKENTNIKDLFQELLQMDSNHLFATLNRSQTANKSFRLLSHASGDLNKKCDII